MTPVAAIAMDGPTATAPAPEAPAAPATPPAGPSPVPAELTPYQRRKAREAERKRKAEERREKRAAKAAAPPPAEATAAAPPTDPGIPERTTEQRAKDCTAFLRGLFRVLSFVAPLFGYDLSPLPVDQARADATYWVPLAERYTFFDRLVTWFGAPVALVERLAEHLKARPKSTPKGEEAPS